MAFGAQTFPMASHLRIKPSLWHTSFSLCLIFHHFLVHLLVCICHTSPPSGSFTQQWCSRSRSLHFLPSASCKLSPAERLCPVLHSALCSNVPSSGRPSLRYHPFLKPLLRPLTLICFSSTLSPEYPITCLFFTCQASLSLEHKLQYGQGLHYVHTKNSGIKQITKKLFIGRGNLLEQITTCFHNSPRNCI